MWFALRPKWRALLMLMVLLGTIPVGPSVGQDGGWIQSDRTQKIAKASLNETYVVRAPTLNVREEPTIGSPAIVVLKSGDVLRRLSHRFNNIEKRDWFRVATRDGREGWVAAEFLDSVAAAVTLVENAAVFIDQTGDRRAAAALAPLARIKAGFVYVGPVSDAGWSYQHDRGRQELAKLPFVESTGYIESVPEEPRRVEEAIERLIASGHNLIFTTSYGYIDPTITVAKRHPDVIFMHASGAKTAPNVGSYLGRDYEVRYLTGLIASATTRSNIIGYVAAFPIPEVIRGINAFTIGVRSVNPDVVVRVRWTNTWYSPGVERAQAEALLDGGADVLAHHQNTPAVVQAAEQHGARAIGFHSDMSVFAPNAILTSAVWDWGVIYREIVKALHAGSWRPDDQVWWGLDRGVVGLAPLAKDLPAAVTNLVEQRRQQLIDRQLQIFKGPIMDNAGKVQVPADQVMTEVELLTMDFLVKGVQGELKPTTALPLANRDNAG